ncbi:MAG: DUF4955 domain-containing protein [Phocaeicola sp.]
MRKSLILNLLICGIIAFGSVSCKDDAVVNPGDISPELPEGMSDIIDGYNANISAYQKLFAGKQEIIDCIKEENGGYRMMFSDMSSFTAYENENMDKNIPIFSINGEGYWVYILNDTEYTLTDNDGKPVVAVEVEGRSVVTPQLLLSSEGKWKVSFNGVQWSTLSDVVVSDIAEKKASDFALYKSVSYNEKTRELVLVSLYGETRKEMILEFGGTTLAWKKFVMKSEDNLLLDFSYAGYKHGEVAPPDGFALGYEVINIAEEMKKKGESARNAFVRVLQEKQMTKKDGKNQNNPDARVVLYFPEGDYVLHSEDDNWNNTENKDNVLMSVHDATKPYDPTNVVDKTVAYGLDSKGNNTSDCIIITAGNFVIKGDGRNRTRLIMRSPMLPTNPAVLYSSPDMLMIKHNSAFSELCAVVSDAAKGSFSVDVASPGLINIGDWVCLNLKNNDPELIAEELRPHAWESYMNNLSESGVTVEDYHQVVAKRGNTIVFKEPIMHEVKAKWNWKICKFNHYENVGVEDLTFVGNSVADFKHHRSWIDDGAYKPVSFGRLTNSWLRRVDFENVSEAMSISGSANCSAYDVNITGNRGHSAIRSAGSSRIFIGAVTDRTAGPAVDDANKKIDDAGQYHACGVSKPSMGAVIWNVHWGTDGCFEAHATQPRATLIDNCQGGFMQSRQGGDSNQVPNHLADLTIWNMNVEQVGPLSNKGDAPADGKFDWWRYGSGSSVRVANNWKFLPPVVVGMHGMKIDFVQDEKQIKLDESNGTKVEPESLYEAQLKLRLGYVPSWLLELKGK